MQPHLSFMALFDIDEVVRGRRLGTGGFSHVYAAVGFVPSEERNDRLSMSQLETRQLFASNATNETGKSRFAIKVIQPSMMNDEHDFRMAAGGLANEADILSKVDHPNIIKLRGHPADGVNAYVRTDRYDGYFLILDRLDETLTDRIESWKRNMKRLKNPIYVLKQARRKHDLLLERLSVALDIASALEYLHSKRIIYRDLKADNIGYNESGWKLFDFGLSRALPRDGDDLAGSFQMSGKVGTKMYMAPEVYERKAYNTQADVYSFALLLWEMLSLQRPFAKYTKKMYRIRVVKKGERPPIDISWPMEIQILLRRAWSKDADARPTMKQVCSTLEKLINEMNVGKPSQAPRNAKKTTLVPNSITPSAA